MSAIEDPTTQPPCVYTRFTYDQVSFLQFMKEHPIGSKDGAGRLCSRVELQGTGRRKWLLFGPELRMFQATYSFPPATAEEGK